MSFDGWRELKLSDVCEFQEGYVNPSQKKAEYFGDEIKWLRANDLNNGFVYDTSRKLSCAGFKSAGKSALLFEPDTIVISKSGTIGRLGIIKDYMCGNRATINIKTIKDIADYRYIFYYLLRNQAEIEDMAVGSVQRNLYTSILGSIPITLPPLKEQQFIAATLSCLDDKIELNNRINKTHEEMAQAIFKSWFVDFEPFQDGEFEDSELGMIPKGWRVGRLSEIIDIFDSKRIPLSNRQREVMEKKYPYYGAASLMDYVDDYIFDGTYVLLGEDGTVVDNCGYPILQYVWGKFWVNNHAHILKGKNGFTEESIYMLLKNTSVQGIVTGAVQPKINQANLKSLTILIPPKGILLEYNNFVRTIFAEKRRGYEENQALKSIRDILLPKLMSGEIRVPVEEVQ